MVQACIPLYCIPCILRYIDMLGVAWSSKLLLWGSWPFSRTWVSGQGTHRSWGAVEGAWTPLYQPCPLAVAWSEICVTRLWEAMVPVTVQCSIFLPPCVSSLHLLSSRAVRGAVRIILSPCCRLLKIYTLQILIAYKNVNCWNWPPLKILRSDEKCRCAHTSNTNLVNSLR